MLHGAALGVTGGEIDPAQAREGNGPGAHGAGFQRHIEVATVEPLVAQRACGGANGEDLGVGGRVAVADDPIAGGGEDDAIAREHSADGRFAARGGRPGLVEGPRHGVGVRIARLIRQVPLPLFGMLCYQDA